MIKSVNHNKKVHHQVPPLILQIDNNYLT